MSFGGLDGLDDSDVHNGLDDGRGKDSLDECDDLDIWVSVMTVMSVLSPRALETSDVHDSLDV